MFFWIFSCCEPLVFFLPQVDRVKERKEKEARRKRHAEGRFLDMLHDTKVNIM